MKESKEQIIAGMALKWIIACSSPYIKKQTKFNDLLSVALFILTAPLFLFRTIFFLVFNK